MKEILKKLCTETGISGRESEMKNIIKNIISELVGGIAEIINMPNGNIIAVMGNKNSDYNIMIDAHIDRIGLVVTYIDGNGFIKADPVGGIDLRTLPSSAVIINGKEKINGVICTMPPHIDKGEGELSSDKIWIDTGLSADEVKKAVNIGDDILVISSYRELLNNKAAVSALDNRAGCAALIRCMELIKDKTLDCKVSFVFSVQEETNESGAKTAAFMLNPNEAVIVDVGFASQDGVPSEKSGKIGCGSIISIAPVLSKKVTKQLINIAEEIKIDVDFEVDGGNTGTNADGVAVTKNGIPCGVLSIPEKNMHSQTEMVSLDDIEKTSKILSEYLIRGGIKNA